MKEVTGKARGGIARRDALTQSERKSIAKKAAAARWDGTVLKATHGDPAHPLKIGNLEIPCYVLEDGRRVLSLGGMVKSLGMSSGSAGGGEGDRLASFISGKAINPFVSGDLISRMTTPIRFRAPTGGVMASGYEATILPELCDAVLTARNAGALLPQQKHIAEQCEILVRGLARVGIIALVDEATGYQRDRTKDALSKILEAFIPKELQPYLPTFPADFYSEMFRLRGLDFPNGSVKRPQYFGMLTNDIVYKRLAPGVLDELKRVIPKNESGRPKNKLFQGLTSNLGYPKLREHLGGVVMVMKLSRDYKDFVSKLDKIAPRYGETMSLPFDYEEDDGKGL